MSEQPLIVERWLAVTETGNMRLTTRKPALTSREIAVLLKLELPRALFRRPDLKATIVVPEDVQQPMLDALVLADVSTIVARELGMQVNIELADTRPQEESNGA